MNVLMIGTDHTMAMDKEKAPSDSQDRHILYGRYVSNLFIIAFSGKTKGLQVKRLSENVIVYPICYTNPFSYLWEAYKTAKRLCQENKIDVITTQDPLMTGLIGYAIKRKFHIPLNVHLHGDYLDNPFWLKETKLNYILNKLGKLLIRRADSVRVVSALIEAKVAKLGVARDRISFIPTGGGIEPGKFAGKDGSGVRETYSDRYDELILFVGRLVPPKNVPNLLKAIPLVLQSHPRALFLMIGEGKERDDLTRMSAELRIENNIVFLGAVPHKELPLYFAACDLFVLPSNREGTAIVLEEAAAAGKPIVTTNVSGASEVVVHGVTGYIVEPGNPPELAQAIIRILDNPEMAVQMGKRGQEHVLAIYNRAKNVGKIIAQWSQTANQLR